MKLNNHHIAIRPLQLQDYEPLQQIICATWKFTEFCSAPVAQDLARFYFLSSLAHQTFTRVVTVHDVVAGVIMGKNRRRRHSLSPAFRHQVLLSKRQLQLSADGRAAYHLFNEVEHIYHQLEEASQHRYAGELSFFIIHEAYRGLGLGKKLFAQFLHYMQREGMPDFLVYTDTECDYQFYEAQGLQRKEKQNRIFTLDTVMLPIEFYLYAYQCAT